jgi:hypothetical protein
MIDRKPFENGSNPGREREEAVLHGVSGWLEPSKPLVCASERHIVGVQEPAYGKCRFIRGRKKTMRGVFQNGLALLAIPLVMIGFSSQAFGQAVEVEPNDPCTEAQDIGPIDVTGAFSVQGSLDTPPDEPDVDFFRFSATPGAQVTANHEGEDTGAGTLPDPLLGLFDTDCNLLASDDDSGVGVNSRLTFDVPADGVFVLAATSFPDFDFTGQGNFSGTYQLTISPPPPFIGSISGRIVDARTGEPLPGNEPPFASADLVRCEGDTCEFVSSQSADGEGRFRFERDSEGQPLLVGTYEVVAFANEFETAQTDPFDVGEGEDFDVGDIPIQPLPLTFSDIQPCEDLLPQGDICQYSVLVTNNTDAPVRGLAWSLVDGFNLLSSLGFTTFEASTRGGSLQAVRQRLKLAPLGEATLEFQFDVPPFVLGAEFCTRAFIGVDPRPLVTTVRESFLFCIIGTDTGFEVMSESESQEMFQSLSERSRNLPEKRPVPAR